MRTRESNYADVKRAKTLYSFQIFVGGAWHRVCEGFKPAMWETREEMEAERARFRKMKVLHD